MCVCEYVADEAGYSHNYATKASTLQDGGASKGMQYDECEMLLVSLLSGNTIEMDRDECDDQTMRETCHELKTPPTVDGCISAGVTQTKDGVDRCTRTPRPNVGNFKYNTVRGYTQTDQRQGDGSWIKDAACPRSKIWIVYENGRACEFLSTYLPFDARTENGRCHPLQTLVIEFDITVEPSILAEVESEGSEVDRRLGSHLEPTTSSADSALVQSSHQER